MLDFLEAHGFDMDSLDSGHSLRLHGFLFPNSPPQSLCAFLLNKQLWALVGAIGFWHCLRSWERYHG